MKTTSRYVSQLYYLGNAMGLIAVASLVSWVILPPTNCATLALFIAVLCSSSSTAAIALLTYSALTNESES